MEENNANCMDPLYPFEQTSTSNLNYSYVYNTQDNNEEYHKIKEIIEDAKLEIYYDLIDLLGQFNENDTTLFVKGYLQSKINRIKNAE